MGGAGSLGKREPVIIFGFEENGDKGKQRGLAKPRSLYPK